MFVFSRWDDAAQSEAAGSWSRGAWKNLEPHTHGFYVNEFNDDSARMRATYGPNYDRLVALKTKFDPDNLFRLNANVAPKGAQPDSAERRLIPSGFAAKWRFRAAEPPANHALAALAPAMMDCTETA